MFSLVFMETWQQFGSAMLIYLAGVLSIPRDWYEAAEIDGAASGAGSDTLRCLRCGI
ncbi:hypothetical protein HMSSN036_37660 [Paenibacillus macerans]|nr:hypothetical protein HMSSN036_37660 [Paenibacillus macerans]